MNPIQAIHSTRSFGSYWLEPLSGRLSGWETRSTYWQFPWAVNVKNSGGIDEIIRTGMAPGIIVRDGKTEQRKLEDQSAKDTLKGCRWLEERDSGFDRDLDIKRGVIKAVWESEIADQRKNSITERYDDAIARAEEKATKLDETGL